ncbi:hypothetical protein IQ22_03661 [Pseudomonas duriflava]|uniref:Lipoprotein n=1 Tax=Pseudomonas duriflava TaxID=459528 RepID=A0A562Q2Q3_9PSED|nr:hypothetical protein [Pseudomonas duriflava]TWI50961.1 hypothetical protein IQ22_03661 [Pseudomonas duriflava]
MARRLWMLFLLALTGCAAFPGHQVAVTPLPLATEHTIKPGLHVEFNFYRGTPGETGARSIPIVREGLEPALIKALAASELFSHITLAPEPGQIGDYVLKLKVYNHSSLLGSVASGLITGTTLFIVPGVAKDHYTMTGELLAPSLVPLGQHRNEETVSTWMGIWFLPLMKHTTADAINDAFNRQVNELLKTLIADRPELQLIR